MAFLSMLGDLMKFLFKAPTRVIDTLNNFISQRMKTEKAFTGVGKEIKEVGKVRKFFRFVGVVLVYILLVALLVGIFVGLWYLNDALNLPRVLGGPWPFLRDYWLPLLFLLFLVSCIIGIRLLRSLGPDRVDVEFEDLEDAWTQAKAALVDAGIVLTNVPVFLVLGRNASNLHAILSASRLTFAVQQVPLKSNAPLQVYANRQAVYIVAPDACLLGRQAELLYEADAAAEPPAPTSAAPFVFEEPPVAAAPSAAPAPVIEPFPAMDNLLADPASVGLLTEPETAAAMPWQSATQPRMPALLKRTDEVDKYKSRLSYLARRLARDRAPYCPLNGILLLIPFNALATEEDGSQIASICEADLQVLHDTARTRCPVVVLVTDLETAPGYAALGERLDADRRVRLFGQDLPLLPDVKPSDIPLMLAGSVRHFSGTLTRWIFRLLRVEQTALDAPTELIASNSRLFEMLGAIRKREPALERLLARILAVPPSPSGRGEGLELMLAGYYLAATGMNPDKEQAFVPGIFQQLVQNQNAVTWTQAALTEEADYRRWTTYGYAALGVFVISVAAIIYARWQMLRW